MVAKNLGSSIYACRLGIYSSTVRTAMWFDKLSGEIITIARKEISKIVSNSKIACKVIRPNEIHVLRCNLAGRIEKIRVKSLNIFAENIKLILVHKRVFNAYLPYLFR